MFDRLYVLARGCGAACVLALLLAAPHAAAQASLARYDEETTVRRISFKFVTTQTFETDRLKRQIALTEPSFWDRLQRILPLLEPSSHPFDPVTLQMDVVRLRNFYNEHGFLHPEVGYAASQLDTASNTIHVIFSVEEGPPLIIQDVGFFDTEGRYAYYQFPEEEQDSWTRFRNQVAVNTGERYTDFDRIRIRDRVAGWLRDRGYAFARTAGVAEVDTAANTVDLRFIVDPGPVAYFDTFEVEGNESVSREVILRELPVRPGQRFSQRRLMRGQQEIFGLNLFRLALISVPDDQPRDSTVHVLVRVREARPRYVTAQTGYGREDGMRLEGEWTHRNFLGGARTLTVGGVWSSGYGALVPALQSYRIARRVRASVSLRQPYLFTTRLSGILSPFYLRESSPLLEGQEVGLNTTLIYEVLPFRTISFQHTFSSASVLGQRALDVEATETSRDLFNKSIFSLNATFGRVNDYINPRRGFLVRPFAEAAGQLPGRPFASDIQYTKLGTEVTAYVPVLNRVSLNARLFAGRIFLLGDSRYDETDLFDGRGRISAGDSLEALLENRFDPIRFYAGGGSDVRGWNNRQLGPIVVRGRAYIGEDGELQADSLRVEELGGLAKLAGNLEARLPFPGLGSLWSTALFLDAGQVTEGALNPGDLRYAVGTGIRYETLVGFIRLDVGFKVNPAFEDLLSPEEIYLRRAGFLGRGELTPSFWRRFAIHVSIGQTF